MHLKPKVIIPEETQRIKKTRCIKIFIFIFIFLRQGPLI
jgi:hypothetical protein